MFFSNQLKNISNLKHCFFSRKNGVSKGIYNSLNCGINSKDNKENVIQNINIVSKKLNCEKKPIVALTAHAMQEEKIKTKEAGFNAHITKPVTAETLVQTVLELI